MTRLFSNLRGDLFGGLTSAVAIGLILAGIVTACWMETQELKGLTRISLANGEPGMLSADMRAILRQADGLIEVVRLCGSFSFASARQLTQMLGGILQGPHVRIFYFAQVAQVDTSVAYAIDELISDAQAAGVSCYVSGLSGTTAHTLAGLGVLAKMTAGKFCQDRKSALERAVTELPGTAAA